MTISKLNISPVNERMYPTTLKVNCIDNYHGTLVPDPYRWLEDESSPERLAWITAQNALTAQHLANAPVRHDLLMRFRELLHYARHYDLIRQDGCLLFKKNDGLQNQLVVCMQQDLSSIPEILIDPTQLTPSGTTRVTSVVPNRDGRYVAYGLSDGGVDWEEYCVKDMTTRQDLPRDRLQWVKASTIAWYGHGFYYSRYPEPRSVTAFSARNEHHQVCYHQIGTSQSEDVLVYEDPDHPLWLYLVHTTDDERFVTLSIFDRESTQVGNALWLINADAGKGNLAQIVTSFENEFRVVDSDQHWLLIVTTSGAPNGRLVLIDPANAGERNWKDVLPEREHPLELVSAIGEKLFALYRTDATHRLYVCDRAGRLENEIPLPGIGLAHVFPGRRRDSDMFWSFTNFTTPHAIYRYDIPRRTCTVFHKPEAPLDPGDYETTNVSCPSKDGTPIPMFIVHRKGLKLDGQNPSLLQGYGGNGFSLDPSFDPLLFALLERGVVFAVAGLRGGGEYGEAWHRAGRLEKKQNVFDDCVAAAEWLQAHGYTNPEKAALIGTSNGGLLVGAVMVQRPDLFRVALPGAGILDMLRYQHFTLGWSWAPEYGLSDDPAMFPILLAYSPLHNIKKGVSYPATLLTTYERDDCVVPAHSFKFLAALQDLGAGPNPYLIRVESDSGHGAVSLPKELEERADLYAFLLTHLLGPSVATA